MNYPNSLPFAVLCLVFIIPLLTACPPKDDPGKDDSSKPADDGTGDGGGDKPTETGPTQPAAAVGDGDGDPGEAVCLTEQAALDACRAAAK